MIPVSDPDLVRRRRPVVNITLQALNVLVFLYGTLGHIPYLIAGLVAAGAQIMVDTRSQVPMVGASGAIAGVPGAYLVLHPSGGFG